MQLREVAKKTRRKYIWIILKPKPVTKLSKVEKQTKRRKE